MTISTAVFASVTPWHLKPSLCDECRQPEPNLLFVQALLANTQGAYFANRVVCPKCLVIDLGIWPEELVRPDPTPAVTPPKPAASS